MGQGSKLRRVREEIAKAEAVPTEEKAIALLIQWYSFSDGCLYARRNDWRACPESGGWDGNMGPKHKHWCHFCKTEELLKKLGRCPERR